MEGHLRETVCLRLCLAATARLRATSVAFALLSDVGSCLKENIAFSAAKTKTKTKKEGKKEQHKMQVLPQTKIEVEQTCTLPSGRTIELSFAPVYIPQTRNITDEIESCQKIGGTKPLLLFDKKWPENLQFVAQFLDTRPKHKKEFVQLFMTSNEELDDIEESSNCSLEIFDLKGHKTLRYKKVTSVPDWVSKEPYYKFELISGWIQTYEVDVDKLEQAGEEYDDIQFVLEKFPHCETFKIGGFGNSCQGEVYNSGFINNVYANNWGDSGSVHVDSQGRLAGDMC
jgi:hypothetical protein